MSTHSVDGSLTDLVLDAARSVRRAAREALEPLGICPHQARALMVINRAQDPIRISELARHLDIARRSATEVVDFLEAQGYAIRLPDPADRRAYVLDVTTDGREVCRRIDDARTAGGDELFSRLSSGERAELSRLLAKALT